MWEMAYGGVDERRHFQIKIKTRKPTHRHRTTETNSKRFLATKKNFFFRCGGGVGS